MCFKNNQIHFQSFILVEKLEIKWAALKFKVIEMETAVSSKCVEEDSHHY